MKPYGYRPGDELHERELGATSKHRKTRGTVRTKARRLLHKQARNDAKKLISPNE